MTEQTTVTCTSRVWQFVLHRLKAFAEETVDYEKSKEALAVAAQIDPEAFPSDLDTKHAISMCEYAAEYLRHNFDLFEMNQPSGDTKAVSEAVRRLKRNLESGEVTL